MRNLLFLALFTSSVAQAQTGPGGVGDATTNVLWLSADSGVYNDAGTTLASNGNNVRQWNDRSGNGHHAGETTAGNRPNYQTSTINGKPAIRYTAANNDRLVSTGLASANRASLWVVSRYTSLPSPNPGLLQGAATGNALSATAGLKNVGMWLNSTNSRPWGRGVRSDGTILDISQTTGTTTNTTYIINNDYGASTIQQYINNATAGSVATDGTLRSWTDMAVGMQAGSEGWNGDIAEVVAYNVSLNSTQRMIVANYLAAKYGLGLTTGDLYVQDAAGNGNYDHDVAGIGRTSATDLHTSARGSGIVQLSKSTYGGLGDNEYLLWGHDNGTLGAFGSTDFPPECQGRLIRTWRVSEVNAAGTGVNVGDVDMTWDLAGLGPVVATELCLLVDTDNDGLFADESPITGASFVSGTLYRFSAVSALVNSRRFTLGTTSMSTTPLPVELVSFSAALLDDQTVQLDWSTATELNNDHFTVERSIDLATWSVEMELPAVGNSQTATHYVAVDHHAPLGAVYYRLRQTDADGSWTLSNALAVVVSGKGMEPVVFPNPNSGTFDLHLPWSTDASMKVTLLDATGRSIGERLLPGAGGPMRFPMTWDLRPGAYLLKVDVDGECYTQRFQVVR